MSMIVENQNGTSDTITTKQALDLFRVFINDGGIEEVSMYCDKLLASVKVPTIEVINALIYFVKNNIDVHWRIVHTETGIKIF